MKLRKCETHEKVDDDGSGQNCWRDANHNPGVCCSRIHLGHNGQQQTGAGQAILFCPWGNRGFRAWRPIGRCRLAKGKHERPSRPDPENRLIGLRPHRGIGMVTFLFAALASCSWLFLGRQIWNLIEALVERAEVKIEIGRAVQDDRH